jgi:hypothetical protein
MSLLRLIQTKCRSDFGIVFVCDAYGISVDRFDPDIGGQLIAVAIINISPARSDFHGSQVLPVRLSGEMIMLDDLKLNQTPHQHQTQHGQENRDHRQPAFDGLRGGVAGF